MERLLLKFLSGSIQENVSAGRGDIMESVNDRSFTLKPYTLHDGCPHIQWRAPFVPFKSEKRFILISFGDDRYVCLMCHSETSGADDGETKKEDILYTLFFLHHV